jgi:hypothetical protein
VALLPTKTPLAEGAKPVPPDTPFRGVVKVNPANSAVEPDNITFCQVAIFYSSYSEKQIVSVSARGEYDTIGR